MKVAYLGPEKTFTEKATKEMFPNQDYVPLSHIKKVILAVENSEVDFGVVPLENYYNGKVIHTLDALTKYSSNAKIMGEKALAIVHCFGALKDYKNITQIFSKDQALEQCDNYLSDKYPLATLIPVASTDLAVKRIAKEKLLDSAAIASEEAVIGSGLEILAKDICPNNITRFIALGRDYTESTGNDKTFLAIHPPRRDKPGTLFHCLAPLKAHEINMEDVITRPDKKGGYYFYFELNGHINDLHLSESIRSIKSYLDINNEFPDAIKIFGSYPNTNWKDGVANDN